jgi:hypothetical protein
VEFENRFFQQQNHRVEVSQRPLHQKIQRSNAYARPISPKLNTITASSDGRHLGSVKMKNISPFFSKGAQLLMGGLIIDKATTNRFEMGSESEVARSIQTQAAIQNLEA